MFVSQHIACRNANLIRRDAKLTIRQSTRFTASSSLTMEQAVNSRNIARKAFLQLELLSFFLETPMNHVATTLIALPTGVPAKSQTAPSQTSPCQDIVYLNHMADLHESSSANFIISSGSYLSCSICVNTSNNSMEYCCVHCSFSSEGSLRLFHLRTHEVVLEML